MNIKRIICELKGKHHTFVESNHKEDTTEYGTLGRDGYTVIKKFRCKNCDQYP